MRDKQAWSFDVAVHNQLPTLEQANDRLMKFKERFDTFILKGSQIVADAKIGNGELAAFLLHRHWSLEDGRVMMERPRVLQSGKIALITSSCEESAALAAGAVPSRWTAVTSKEKMQALEFSADPFVREIDTILLGKRKVVDALTELLYEHDLQASIGYMVAVRKSLVSQEFSDLVEENEDRMSIVTGQNLSPLERQSHIRTGWALSWTRTGPVWATYCMHGPMQSCKHKTPDPPVCRPHGCV